MEVYKTYINFCFIKCFLLIFVFICTITCHEKTLRKIVRDQSKMVQRPFDDTSPLQPLRLHDPQLFPVHTQMKTMFNRMRPKPSAILTSVETGRGKSYARTNIAEAQKFSPNELRSTRNTFPNTSMASQHKYEVLFSEEILLRNISRPAGGGPLENFHQVPLSNFFPSIDKDAELKKGQQLKADSQMRTIIIPDNRVRSNNNDSIHVKGLIRPMKPRNTKPMNAADQKHITEQTDIDIDSERVDFLIEGEAAYPSPGLVYQNTSTGFQVCSILKTIPADIDAQSKFLELDIEPPWMRKWHYWDSMFNSRYESLMRNPKWPPLKVVLVPRTHVDTIWKKTFEQYNNNSVSNILSNIVKKMQFYANLTFTWHEVSHLSQWWKKVTPKVRTAFRRLVRAGRIEITTGGWVETDEATTHLFGLVHLLVEGHQWLSNHLNYSPKVAWLTNTVTHSPTMTYLLSTLGITNLVFTNIHYSWEKYFAEYQISEFIWLQNWVDTEPSSSNLNDFLKRMGNDRYPRHSVISHYLQFNSDGFKACGPNKKMCARDFNFSKSNRKLDVNSYNVKEKSELLLEQYSKTGTITTHNIIIAPIGGPHRFEYQPEFDYQYNNYLKIADYVNLNREIYRATVEFGTPSDFFNAIGQRHGRYPTLRGDFLNFADVDNGSPAYWAGFFTSRPILKILLRRLESTLRSTEILFSFAISRNLFLGLKMTEIFELLIKCRESVARLLDRNVISGTLTAYALQYVHHKVLSTARDCWLIQEITMSVLSSKNKNKRPYLHKYVYREGEFISMFRTVIPGDQVFVFNSLGQERPEIVEVFTRTPNIRIVDHNRKDVMFQVNPVWKYNSDNVIVISQRFFKITFAVVIPPLTLELFKIKDTYTAVHSIASLYCVSCIIDDIANNGSAFPFHLQSVETGDIQLESYKHRLIFDEMSGFLKAVVEKETNIEKSVVIDYGAFKSSRINSGMFLFNTNISKPLYDMLTPYRVGNKSKIVIIISGQITTEITSIYGQLLQHTVKIFNLFKNPLSNSIYIESKVDYDVSPKNRDLELFLSIQTDIANGSPPEIYTDNNGFQYTPRLLNISRRVESNMYPMTTMSFIQDRRRRLTLVTDHAQGVTALQEGQLLAVLDRRVLLDDGRGAGQGLADSGCTTHRHYILLENFIQKPIIFEHAYLSDNLELPSSSAHLLSNNLNYILDIFIIDRNQTQNCHYTYLPLIQAGFPCDVSLLNYRVVFDGANLKKSNPTTALMILQRQSYSCHIHYDEHIHCEVVTKFSIKDILLNVKYVKRTNLGGTIKGTLLNMIGLSNFPVMELLALRIDF